MKCIHVNYIFTGTEWEVQKIYINQIAKIRGARVERIDTVGGSISKLKNSNNKLLDAQPIVFVVRDDKELLQSEELFSNVKQMMVRSNNILILLLTNVDKRLKFYKTNKDSIVEFESLSDKILTKYIKQHIDLSDKNCQTLIDICEHDYCRILLEIDKITMYDEAGHMTPTSENDAFETLIKDGTIYEPPYDAIFDLVDMILKGKVNKSFDLLEQSYAVGEATMVMLSVLYTNAKHVLQVQSCGSKDIAKTTGLTGWQIKNAKERTGYYSNDELIDMLRLIQKVESGIKRGLIDDEIAMQYVMVNVL